MAATRVQTKGGAKASGIMFIILGIILFIIGGIIFASNAGYMISGECKDLQSYLGGPYPTGEYVKINLDSVLGNYAETKHTTNGIPTGTDQYYVALLDDNSFISVKIKGKGNVEKMEKVVNETWSSDDWRASTPYEASGKLKASIGNSEIRGFYKDFFNEFCQVVGVEYSELTSQFNVYEYELDCTDSRGSLWGTVGLLAGFGALLFVLGIFYLKKAAKMGEAPAMSYSNTDYTPVDTTQPYNPVDTTQPYNPVDTSQPYNPTDASQQYDQNNF
jgi:hypothetical protein